MAGAGDGWWKQKKQSRSRRSKRRRPGPHGRQGVFGRGRASGEFLIRSQRPISGRYAGKRQSQACDHARHGPVPSRWPNLPRGLQGEPETRWLAEGSGQRAATRQPHYMGILQTAGLALSETSRRYSKRATAVSDAAPASLRAPSGLSLHRKHTPHQSAVTRARAALGLAPALGALFQARWGSSREALLPLPRTLVHHHCPAAVACRLSLAAQRQPKPQKPTRARARAPKRQRQRPFRHARCPA